MTDREALILVDLQNDFCPGGALAVAEGDRVIPLANRLLARFEFSLATQDWHPPDHFSFASNHAGMEVGDVIELAGHSQILWPDHCVQGSPGADFHPLLDVPSLTRVFRKGTDRAVDSYSGFFDNRRLRSTGLEDYLREKGISRLVVMGLATDYCVKFTVLDALSLGFRVRVVREGCRGVELRPGDTARAWQEMTSAGARIGRLAAL